MLSCVLMKTLMLLLSMIDTNTRDVERFVWLSGAFEHFLLSEKNRHILSFCPTLDH